MFKCFEEVVTPIMKAFNALDAEQKEFMETCTIVKWYAEHYPGDKEMIQRLDPELTLAGMVRCFSNDVYSYTAFFANDSIVRERVFLGFSEMLSLPYSFFYNNWLNPWFDIDPHIKMDVSMEITTDNNKGWIVISAPGYKVLEVYEDIILGGRYGTWTECRKRPYLAKEIRVNDSSGLCYGRKGVLRKTHWDDDYLRKEDLI